MFIRFTKPQFPKENTSNQEEPNQQTLLELQSFINELKEYLNSLQVMLYLFSLAMIILTWIYSWLFLIVFSPFIIYFLRKYNLTKFEFSIHCFMLQLTREIWIEKSTGHSGPILSHL